jgi:hypothetical protein
MIVIMLSVIMLSAVMLNVVAPKKGPQVGLGTRAANFKFHSDFQFSKKILEIFHFF